MNDGPISTNPNAVGEVTGGLASFGKKLMGAVTGQKKSRTDEMSDSAALHKTVLAHQAAEHSHELKKMRLAHKNFSNLNVRSGKAVEYESGGTKVKATYGGTSPAAKKSTAKKPATPKATTKSTTKPVVSAESVKARKGK
jgi:hypothetical protein